MKTRTALPVLMLILLLVSCGQASTLPGSDEELLGRSEDRLESFRQQLKIPGLSAAIVQDQQLVWAKGFGYAELRSFA